MTKKYSRFLTVLFCLFIGGMMVWSLLLPDRKNSDVENRPLQQAPKFSIGAVLDGSFMSETEKYIADQFPLRDQWTGLKSRAEDTIGKRLFNGVYLCKNTLITKVDPPADCLENRNLEYVKQLSGKTHAKVYLGLVPSAAEVWKDKLPSGAVTWNQTAYLKRAGKKAGVSTVDFLSVLKSHAAEDIYYRTDHHWTTLGAYYGYTAVMKTLGREGDTQPSSAFHPETVSRSFDGTLYSKSGIHWLKPDSIQYWVPDEGMQVTSWRSGKAEKAPLYDTSFLKKKDQYASFLGGNQPLCVIKNNRITDGSKILLVRDSYSDSLAPFLAQHFGEVHLLDLRYYRASVADYAKKNNIKQIVVLYSVPDFVTDSNLVFLGL